MRLDDGTGGEYRFVPSKLMQEVTRITEVKDFEIQDKKAMIQKLKISKVAEIA